MNPYCRLIPRLNGKEIEKRFNYYLGLAKKGVAGFIIFGGELRTVREGIRKLQDASPHPLMIASDLEQGLGQQIEGGTIFPPAMAIASALTPPHPPLSKGGNEGGVSSRLNLLRKTFKAIAIEAKYAGINTILAPVLDINTNPENPIIATRAFGEDPETVSYFGCKMVRILQKNGIMACGKHFPGHGDTEIDSHIDLPVIRKDVLTLEGHELVPFKRAIHEGVGMIMLGHLSVPSIDPSEKPASLSEKVASYLKFGMGFKGIVITDAMNMGAISEYDENEASLMALKAGVDIILHPSDPDATASYLRQINYRTEHSLSTPLVIPPLLRGDIGGVKKGNERLNVSFDFNQHQKLSEKLTKMAIKIQGNKEWKIENPFVLILDEDATARSHYFIDVMGDRFPNVKYRVISEETKFPRLLIPQDRDIIVAIYSSVRARTRKTGWLRSTLQSLKDKAGIFVSFGNPYVLKNLPNVTKIYAHWDSELAQEAVAKRLISEATDK